MAEIKKINVDGVDYDIVSESAERKIAELEKTNTALASVTIGPRDTSSDYIHVGLGTFLGRSDVEDIMIGRGVRIGENVVIGSQYPVLMEWDDLGNFTVSSNGGNRAPLTLGSNLKVRVDLDSNSELKMTSSAVNIYESYLVLNNEGLRFGNDSPTWIGKNISISMHGSAIALEGDDSEICNLYAHECGLYLGTIQSEGGALKLTDREVTLLEIGPRVSIGWNLPRNRHLTIKGPVYLEASEEPYLTIGKDGIGGLKIDWSGDGSAITFTHVSTGKKATLTLS